MGPRNWSMEQRDGTLTATTGVTGRAARFGHRLTIGFPAWRISVSLDGDEPTAVDLHVEVGELQVLRGEGGVTPLSAPERAVARGNALATLRPDAHPLIVYSADVGQRSDGYLLRGALTINGVSREQAVPVICGRQGRQTTFTVSATVRHSEHDLQPYSLMMGTLKVADEVRVDFAAAAEIPR